MNFKGTYMDYNGYFSYPTSCTACPLGTYAAALGSTKCSMCPNGYQCYDPTQGKL